jgi:hypothetical protein
VADTMPMLNPCLKQRRGPGTTIATIARAALEAWPEEIYIEELTPSCISK